MIIDPNLTYDERWEQYYKYLAEPDHYRSRYKALTEIINEERRFRLSTMNQAQKQSSFDRFEILLDTEIGANFEVVLELIIKKQVKCVIGTDHSTISEAFDIIGAMSNFCLELKRYKDGKKFLKRAIEFCKIAFRAHFSVIDLVLASLNRLMRDFIQCMHRLHCLQEALQDISEIINIFESLNEKKPKNYGYLSNAKGEILEKLGKIDETIIEYKKSIKCSKKYFLFAFKSDQDINTKRGLMSVYREPNLNLSRFFESKGRYKEAVEVLEKYIEVTESMTIDDNHDDLWMYIGYFNIAELYFKMSKFEKAKEWLVGIAHHIRMDAKTTLKRVPLKDFNGCSMLFIDMGMFRVIDLYHKCIDEDKLQEAKSLVKQKSLPTLAKHLFDFLKSESNNGTLQEWISLNSWVNSILGITLDCLKDNIIYCNLNEVYVLKLQYISMENPMHSTNKPDALFYGLKVLSIIKDKGDTHLLPQTYEILIDLSYDLKLYDEALDLLMESVDYSPIDYFWHKKMAECYLNKFQFDRAKNHIQDCQNFESLKIIFEHDCIKDVYCMNIGDFTNGPLAHVDGQNLFRQSAEIFDLYLFKNKRYQDCKERILSDLINIEYHKRRRSILFFLLICCEFLMDNKLLVSQFFLKKFYEEFEGLKVTYLLQNIHQYVFNHVCVRSGQFVDLENVLFTALKKNWDIVNCTRNDLCISQSSCFISKHFRIALL